MLPESAIEKKKQPAIVILGAGFGGITAYRRLRERGVTKRARVILINRENHFLFMPLLHEVATGGLASPNIVVSLREVVGKDSARVVQADTTGIDIARKVLHTSAGDISYDHLVIATGSEVDYFGVRGAREHTIPLKTIADAKRIRSSFISAFEHAAAEAVSGKPSCLLEFVIVGGGPTGVELAGEIADLFTHTLRTYFSSHLDRWHFRITLVQSGATLLRQFAPKLREQAHTTLNERGIRVILGRQVNEVRPGIVVLDNGEELPACNVIWAAGVKPSVPQTTPAIPRQAQGRILVDEMLRVPGLPGVWAIGDAAASPGRQGALAPLRAQAAVQEGNTVADNIASTLSGRSLRPFAYRHHGDLVSLGRWRAVADIGGIRWSGRFAWWLNRTIYLFNFPSWAKRIRIAVDWTVNLFHPRDISGV